MTTRGYPGFNGATFTISGESGNAITVNVQLEENGQAAGNCTGIAYLSSDTAGDVLEAGAAGLSIAVGTDGLIETVAASGVPVFFFKSESDGDLDVVVTQTGADTHYLNIVHPDGINVTTSAALTFT